MQRIVVSLYTSTTKRRNASRACLPFIVPCFKHSESQRPHLSYFSRSQGSEGLARLSQGRGRGSDVGLRVPPARGVAREEQWVHGRRAGAQGAPDLRTARVRVGLESVP